MGVMSSLYEALRGGPRPRMRERGHDPAPGSVDFEHQIEIRIGQAELHAFLCDLENYVPLHPLIVSITEIEPRPELPNARRFRVVDRIPIGPFRLRTTYEAVLDPVGEGEVHGHAWQSPGVRLWTSYRLEPVHDGTRLIERVQVRAPRLLRRYVVDTARASHAAMLAGLKALLEDDAR